ncbi:unnamed protein product [Symbiodinium sp. CCMP2592]|nr:unnamed protein product [Symbiodinium sp. CCMP2592]
MVSWTVVAQQKRDEFAAQRQREEEEAEEFEAAQGLEDDLTSFVERHPPPKGMEDVEWRWLPESGVGRWAVEGRLALAEQVAKILLGAQRSGKIRGLWRVEAPSIQHAENELSRAQRQQDDAWQEQMKEQHRRSQEWKEWETEGDKYMQEVVYQLWDTCISGSEECEMVLGDLRALVEKWQPDGQASAYQVAEPKKNKMHPGGLRAGHRLVAFGVKDELAAEIQALPEGARPFPEEQPRPGEFTWYLLDQMASFALQLNPKALVRVQYFTREGYWAHLESTQHALTRVWRCHSRAQSGFAKASNWTGFLNLVADMVGIGDTRDVTEGRGAWQETFSGFLPMRIEVHYGSGKAFSADKEQKTKMEANVLEAAVGELLASKDDACIALARLISVLCGLCALYPPVNLPPSNRHMLFKYASKICSPVPGHRHLDHEQLDRWIDDELLKCDWLIGDGEDPGIPDTPELMLEGSSPPPQWGRPDLFARLPDMSWLCLLCGKTATDGHVEGKDHTRYLKYDETKIQQAIRATRDKFQLHSSSSGDPAEDAAGYPPESTPEARGDPGDRTADGPPPSWGRKDIFLKLPDGSWTCLLCDKGATDEHIVSKKHESNLGYPEGEILKWVAQTRQKHAKPQGASSAAAASEGTESTPPAMPMQGAQRPPASWGRAKLYRLNKDGVWECLLCDKVATDEHIQSKGHIKYITNYPEKDIDKYIREALARKQT